MSSWFEACIWLAQNAVEAHVSNGSLCLKLCNTVEVREKYDVVDLPSTLTYRGQEVELSEIAEGQDFQLEIRDVDGTSSNIAQSLESFLSQRDGLYHNAPPDRFYLLSERYRSGEEPVDPGVSGYLRLPRLHALLRQIADVELANANVHQLVFLGGKRLSVDLVCESASMKNVPSIAAIDALH